MDDRGKQDRPRLGRVWDAVAVNLVLLGAAFALAAAWAARLPARYPVHWSVSGRPDRWATAGSGEWYALPLVALALAALMIPLALLLPRIPMSLWNMPRKEQFMALPKEAREPVVTFLVRWLLHLSSLDTLLMMAIHYAMYRSILGNSAPAVGLLVVVGAVYVGFMVWGVVGFVGQVKRAAAGVSKAK